MPPAKRTPEPPDPPVAADPVDPVEDDAAEDGRPDPHPAPPTDAELAAREREADLRQRELDLRDREAALAARESAVTATAAPTGPPPAPEYWLYLANGERVEAPSAVATHHYGADGDLHRVVSSAPIPGEYGIDPIERDKRDRAALRAELAANR